MNSMVLEINTTTTALAHLLNHITFALDNKKFILSLFLDLSKTFDSHLILLIILYY